MSATAETMTETSLELTVDAAQLREALSRGVSSKKAGDIGEHALLRAGAIGADTLDITTIDPLMARRDTVRGTITAPGEICAHVAELQTALRGWEGEVRLSVEKGWLVVGAADGAGKRWRRFEIASLPADQFPYPEDLFSEGLEADPIAAKEALAAVSYAAPADDGRAVFNGVYLEASVAVATNGTQGANCPVSTGIAEGDEVIIPHDALKAVRAALGEKTEIALLRRKREDKPVGLEVADTAEDWWLRVRLVMGTYPDWRRAFAPADEPGYKLTFDAGAMRAAVARLTPFAFRQETKASPITISKAEDGLQLAAAARSATERVSATVEGEFEEISIDGRWLAQALEHCGDGQAVWQSGSTGAPQLFQGDGRTDRHIVTPFRI